MSKRRTVQSGKPTLSQVLNSAHTHSNKTDTDSRAAGLLITDQLFLFSQVNCSRSCSHAGKRKSFFLKHNAAVGQIHEAVVASFIKSFTGV